MQYILSRRIRQKTSTVINFQFWESLGIKNLERQRGGKNLCLFLLMRALTIFKFLFVCLFFLTVFVLCFFSFGIIQVVIIFKRQQLSYCSGSSISIFFLSYCGGQVCFLHNHMEKCNFTSQEYCMVSGVQKTVCMYFFIARVRDLYSFFQVKLKLFFNFLKIFYLWGEPRSRPCYKKGFTPHSHLYFFKVFQEVVLLRQVVL